MRTTLLITLAWVATHAFAQTSLPVKKATIFKNGTAMIVAEGKMPVKQSSVILPIPEQVLFGTFFIGSSKDNVVKSMTFKNDTVKKQMKSRTLAQTLAGNLNKAVTLSYYPIAQTERTITGKVISCDPGRTEGLLKFMTDAGKIVVMPANKIYNADFKEEPSDYYMADSLRRLMNVKLGKEAETVLLQEVYMTAGINWIPSYYMKLTDGKTARLEMKATIENYAEDLADAETELVVGSPQMQYSSKPDPMTFDYVSVGGIQKNNNSRNDARNGSYDMLSLNSVAVTEVNNVSVDDADYSTSGEKSGDMYIYKTGKINLPNKTKGTFPIFTANVEYKDKYEGTINDGTNYFYNHYVAPEKTYAVYHSLDMTNSTGVPLTSASIMLVNEKDQFVAQDELNYTPAGANTIIRLSKAIDIIMKNTEEEKSREDNSKKIGKATYSKIILKGIINVENDQDKEVSITVTKNLNGTVLTEGEDGKVIMQRSANYVNPSSEIKWEIKMGGNSKKVLNYEYEVYFTP